eukprot:767922-Hanusia_phi.AAC.3
MSAGRGSEVWFEMLEILKEHKEKHGHFTIQADNDKNIRLRRWVFRQRHVHRINSLSKERKEALDAIGFPFLDERYEWNTRFKHVRDCVGNVSADVNPFQEGVLPDELLGFVKEQVRSWSSLSSSQRQKLKGLGVYFYEMLSQQDKEAEDESTAKRLGFDEGIARIMLALNGSAISPETVREVFQSDPLLDDWIQTFRQKWQKASLSPKRLQVLLRMCVDLETETEEKWEEMFGLWKSTSVMSKPEEKKINQWKSLQRRMLYIDQMKASRHELLRAEKFEFEQDAAKFHEMAQLFEAVRQQENEKKSRNPLLTSWIYEQRVRNMVGKLTDVEKTRLESIEFPFQTEKRENVLEDLAETKTKEVDPKWMKKFETVKAFKSRYGHTKVPQKWGEDPVLFSWVFRQRKKMRAGTLSPLKRELLEDIGFADEDNYFETTWDEQLEKLASFKLKFGHTRVPQNYTSLGRWVHEQVGRTRGGSGLGRAEKR